MLWVSVVKRVSWETSGAKFHETLKLGFCYFRVSGEHIPQPFILEREREGGRERYRWGKMKGCRMEKTKAEGRRMGSGRGHLAVMLGLKQSQCKYGNSNAFMKCEIKLTCGSIHIHMGHYSFLFKELNTFIQQ